MLTIFTIMLEATLAKATLTRGHISVQFTLTEAKKSVVREREPILLGLSCWVKGALERWRPIASEAPRWLAEAPQGVRGSGGSATPAAEPQTPQPACVLTCVLP